MSRTKTVDLEAVDGQPMDIRFAKELRPLLTPRILNDDRRESETRLQLYLPNGKGVMLGITPKASVIP